MDIFLLAMSVSIVVAFLGLLLIIIDALRSSGGQGDSRVGGVIIVGPVPIIMGNDRSLIKWAVVLSVIAVLVTLVLILLPYLVKP